MSTADSRRRVTFERHSAQPTPAELRDGKRCARCLAELRAPAKLARLFQPIDGEEWRPVPGYEGLYSASSLGRVRRDLGTSAVMAGTILQPALSGRRYKYLHCRLSSGTALARTFQVHAVIAKAFHGPRPAGYVINHIDGNTVNNAAANLEYVTNYGNERHAAKHGLKAWGERHGMRKLTADDVREIRSSTTPSRLLADRLGVVMGTIQAVRAKRTWRHLDEPGISSVSKTEFAMSAQQEER